MSAMISGYRKYCSGLKKADCLLVEKTRNSVFMRLITEPPVPRRRPDLTTFVHKPLEVSINQSNLLVYFNAIIFLTIRNCFLNPR